MLRETPSPEQEGEMGGLPEKTKAQLFAEDPDRFQDMADVQFAIIRHPENKILGHCINVGKKGESITEVYEECLKLKTFAEHKLNMFLLSLDAQIAERSKAGKIITPNGKQPFYKFGKR